jgi:hypothetical protein
MKLFPYRNEIIALSGDGTRAVIRLRNIPVEMVASEHVGLSCNAKEVLQDPSNPSHKRTMERVARLLNPNLTNLSGTSGPNSGDNNENNQYAVAVAVPTLRQYRPTWFLRTEEVMTSIYQRMQRDEVIPPAEMLTREELAAVKVLWSSKLTKQLDATAADRAKAARVAADAKLGISTAGSHVLD